MSTTNDFFEEIPSTKICELPDIIGSAHEYAEYVTEYEDDDRYSCVSTYISYCQISHVKMYISYSNVFHYDTNRLHCDTIPEYYRLICLTDKMLVDIQVDTNESDDPKININHSKIIENIQYDETNYADESTYDDITGSTGKLELVNTYDYYPDCTINDLLICINVKPEIQ